jgi:hypothetical protein
MVYVLPPQSVVGLGALAVAAAAPDVKRSVVLIFSEDPLAAALIGAAVELAGLAPTFPMAREVPRDALRRLKPGLVLVDPDHGDACAPDFLGPALMTGARVLLVGSGRTRRDTAAVAAQFGLRSLSMPLDVQSIAGLLRRELEAGGG